MMWLMVLRFWGRQRWLPFGVRDRVLRFFAAPESMQGRTKTINYFGQTYECDLGSFVDWMICFYGAYELGVLEVLRQAAHLAGSGAVFLDIGANVGTHSLYMSRYAAQVHAFEPWALARDRLNASLAVNNIKNIHVHPFGLGDDEAELPFFAPDSANLGTGSFCQGVNVNKPQASLRIRRGDDTLAQLGLTRIDVIKIDTEGFEIKVLNGLRDTLWRHAPVLVVEIALAAKDGMDEAAIRALFPVDWQVLMLSAHPEHSRLQRLDVTGLDMVVVVAGPAQRITDLQLSCATAG